jgi:glycosyltransferase involved in cell wall biosynthesis
MGTVDNELLRITVVQATGEIGGAEVSLLRFLRVAHPSKIQAFVCLLGEGPMEDHLSELQVPYEILAHTRFRAIRETASITFKLSRLARRWRSDLVYGNGTKSHLYASPAALLGRLPYVWRLCDMLLPGSSAVYRLAAHLPADLVLTDSDAVAGYARKFKSRWPRMVTVYPGADVDNDRPRREIGWLRQELNLPAETPLAAVVGRLQRWKGQTDLILAAPAVLAVVPDVHFLVVGTAMFGLDRDYPAELERLAAQLGLRTRFHFLGFRPDVADILREIDIVVVPSRTPEPAGTIQMEAMAAERPLVSTAAGGNLEVVVDGETGFLVPPATPERIASAVLRLLLDPELRARMGIAGRQRVERLFSTEQMVAAMLVQFHWVVRVRHR